MKLNDDILEKLSNIETLIVSGELKEAPENEPERQYYFMAKLKEYMDHEMSTMDEGEEERETFYSRKASISFGDKIVILDNCAAVWTALRDAIDYIIENE